MVQRAGSRWGVDGQCVDHVVMERARANIRQALAEAQCPAVMCSFGKDSLLLLWLVREVNPNVPVLWFRNGVANEKFARQIIRQLNLIVYGWHPALVYPLANNGDRSLIQEFSFGNENLPLITDLAPGTRCGKVAFADRTPQMFLPFDLLLTGYKDSDSHWLKGDSELFADDLRVGRAKVRAPIRHMSDEQVRAAVFELNIPYEEHDDALPMCTRCMTENTDTVFCPEVGHEIPAEEYDARLALETFRQRFNLKES